MLGKERAVLYLSSVVQVKKKLGPKKPGGVISICWNTTPYAAFNLKNSGGVMSSSDIRLSDIEESIKMSKYKKKNCLW